MIREVDIDGDGRIDFEGEWGRGGNSKVKFSFFEGSIFETHTGNSWYMYTFNVFMVCYKILCLVSKFFKIKVYFYGTEK